jgi:hypothetical protein
VPKAAVASAAVATRPVNCLRVSLLISHLPFDLRLEPQCDNGTCGLLAP